MSPKEGGQSSPVDEERERMEIPHIELIVEGASKADPDEVTGEQHIQHLCKENH